MGGRGGGAMATMMTGMMGVLGERILVNGSLQTSRTVERRAHRLRLLNGSNTRTYKLAWNDGLPLTVIGTDGGLLAAPLQRDYVMLSPGERLELWVDFAAVQPGAERTLRSLAFEGGIDMGGMMGGGASLPDGAAFDVHRFKVGSGESPREVLPGRYRRASPRPSRAARSMPGGPRSSR